LKRWGAPSTGFSINLGESDRAQKGISRVDRDENLNECIDLRRNELALKAESEISGACSRFAVANHQLFDRFGANNDHLHPPCFDLYSSRPLRSFGHHVQTVESTKWLSLLPALDDASPHSDHFHSPLSLFVAVIFTRLVIFTIGTSRDETINESFASRDFAKTCEKRFLRELPFPRK